MDTKKSAQLSVYTVKYKTFLTPHYIRVTLAATDEQLERLKEIKIGSFNKLFIPPSGVTVIELLDRVVPAVTPYAPTVRTYTTRNIDVKRQEISIDFVAHGDNGPASAWALGASAGDGLGIAFKVSSRPLVPEAERYVLIGDATARPVISAILEGLSPGTKANVLLEVYDQDDELPLHSAADVHLQWLHNPHPERGSRLADVAKSMLPPGAAKGHHIFIAAEQRTVKELRNYIKDKLGLVYGEYQATAYWKAGESEQQSVAERRAEMSQ